MFLYLIISKSTHLKDDRRKVYRSWGRTHHLPQVWLGLGSAQVSNEVIFPGLTENSYAKSASDVLFQKRVRGFPQGFQTREK